MLPHTHGCCSGKGTCAHGVQPSNGVEEYVRFGVRVHYSTKKRNLLLQTSVAPLVFRETLQVVITRVDAAGGSVDAYFADFDIALRQK